MILFESGDLQVLRGRGLYVRADGSEGRLRSAYPQPGILDRLVHLFYAEVTAMGDSAPEADEAITAVALPPSELQARILAGEPLDAELLCALHLAGVRELLKV